MRKSVEAILTSEQKLSPNRLPHPLYNWVSKRDKEIRRGCEFSFLVGFEFIECLCDHIGNLDS